MTRARVASLPTAGLLATGLAQRAPVPAPEGPFAGPREQGVWYESFVRSFQDSDGDGIGDLPGVTRRLPYLADLGVDGIWLTPIHPAASYHGYDVLDSTAVAPECGTLGGPAWHPAGDAWYLGLFGSGMPDLNHGNAEVRDETRRVMRFWLDRGVDGFRVDAIQHLIEADDGAIAGTPATLAWVREMQAWLRATGPHAFWLGETYALSQRSAAPLETALRQNAELYPPGAARAVFSANHDQARPTSTLGVLRRDEPRLRLVAALLATLPGTPLLCYGQEIGLPNGPGDRDEQKRTPMAWRPGPGRGFSDAEPWIAFSSDDPASLWSRYRQAIALRRATPALARGRITLLEPASPSLLAFVREEDGERVLVAANLGTRPAVLAASERPGVVEETLDGAPVGPGDWEIEGLGVRVVRLAPAADRGDAAR